MRIRSIKPEFWRSDTVSAMSHWQRLLFIGLWSYVDDNGVGRDQASLIAADLFAHDLSVNPHGVLTDVSNALDRLHELGVIRRYRTNDGKTFLEVVNWGEHQRINRPAPARYPTSDQPDTTIHDPFTEDSVKPQWGIGAGAGEQGSRGAGSKHLVTADGDDRESGPAPDLFDEFWKHWPRKVKKPDARKAFKRAVKRADPETIIAGAEQFANDPNLPEAQFIPHPATWLNADQWNDPPLPSRSATQPHQSAADRAMQRGAERHQQIENGQLGQSISWDDVFTANQIER